MCVPLTLDARSLSIGWFCRLLISLSVDHVGHTHDIHSEEMLAKLDEMDLVIREVVDALEEEAAAAAAAMAAGGSGGGFERTLLLVMGDHGQTATGEHGGETQEETSTVLMAYSVAPGAQRGKALLREAEKRRAGAGTGNYRGKGRTKKARFASHWKDDFACPRVMQQLDFAATLSTVLGVPIPYSNIGQVSWDLWRLGAKNNGSPSPSPSPSPSAAETETETTLRARFDEALGQNVDQVNRYLSTLLLESSGVAASASSVKEFLSLKAEHESAMRGIEEAAAVVGSGAGESSGSSSSEGEKGKGAALCDSSAELRVAERQRYLDSVAAHARRIWTRFDYKLMGAGLAVNIAAALIQIWQSRQAFFSLGQKNWNHKRMYATGLYALALAMFSLSMLSNSFIISEGSVACFLIATLLFYVVRETVDATNNGAAQTCLVALLVLNALMANLIPQHSGDIWNGQTQRRAFELSPWVADALFLAAVYLGLIQLRKKKGGLTMVKLLFKPKESIFIYNCAVALVHSIVRRLGTPAGGFHPLWDPDNLARQVHALTAVSLGWVFVDSARARDDPKPRLNLALRAIFFVLPELYILQQGNGRAALCLAYLQIFASIILYVKVQIFMRRADLELLCLLCCSLYCAQIFHATGHQCQFSALQYNAAFVGFRAFSWWRGAALLALNTFSSHVLVVLLLAVLYARRGAKDRATAYLAFGLTLSAQSVAVMLCCALHARHLMVWGIFAPKFIFNAAALVLTDLLLLFTYAV